MNASTRREAFAALGVTALSGIAFAGFLYPESLHMQQPISDQADAGLIKACASFLVELKRQHEDEGDDATADVDAAEWYRRLDEVLAAPAPRSASGRTALAKAAQAALLDQVHMTKGQPVEAEATREEMLAFKALRMMAGDAA